MTDGADLQPLSRRARGGCSTRRAILAALAILAAACSDDTGIASALAGAALIHGSDDRLDYFELDDPALRALARNSSLAMLPESALRRSGAQIEIHANTLAESYGLCPSERFGAQPSIANCSAVLVDRDLILTAGHCVSEAWPCEKQRWAFGYALQAPDTPAVVHERDLYRCRSVPVRVGPTADRTNADYALIQLDRPVSAEREPVAVGDASFAGAAASVIGHPSGLPVKIERSARVTEVRSGQSLSLESDTFVGSSGSGVFDANGELVAVFVRGGSDYRYDPAAKCWVARRVEPGPGTRPTEEAWFAEPALAALCGAGWPSFALCGRRGSCGDGHCAQGEHDGGCPGDCPALPLWTAPELAVAPACRMAPHPGSGELGSWPGLALVLIGAVQRVRRARRRAARASASRIHHAPPEPGPAAPQLSAAAPERGVH